MKLQKFSTVKNLHCIKRNAIIIIMTAACLSDKVSVKVQRNQSVISIFKVYMYVCI